MEHYVTVETTGPSIGLVTAIYAMCILLQKESRILFLIPFDNSYTVHKMEPYLINVVRFSHLHGKGKGFTSIIHMVLLLADVLSMLSPLPNCDIDETSLHSKHFMSESLIHTLL